MSLLCRWGQDMQQKHFSVWPEVAEQRPSLRPALTAITCDFPASPFFPQDRALRVSLLEGRWGLILHSVPAPSSQPSSSVSHLHFSLSPWYMWADYFSQRAWE